MKYVMYIDVFFAINFLMDLLILVIAKRFINPQTTIKRCILAALAGATLTCIIIIWKMPFVILQKIFTYVVIIAVMTKIAYRLKGVVQNIKVIVILYVVTFTLSGAVDFIYYYTNFSLYVKELLSFNYLRGINFFTFIFITAIAFFITDFSGKFIRNRMNMKKANNDMYDIVLEYKEKQVNLKGLYDSGNSLMEPIGNTPVHIVEYKAVSNLLEGVDAREAKMKMVPFKALGTEMGVIPAIEIDKMVLHVNGEYIEIGKSMIGLYQGTLSSQGNYNIILNRSIKKWL